MPALLGDTQRVEEIRREFSKPVCGWTQLPTKKLLDAISQCWKTAQGKEELRKMAELLHHFGDRHSHAGSFDTAQYLDADGESIALQVGPSERWVPQALFNAAWCYGQILDLAAEHFKMRDLTEWRVRWQVLMARCSPLPPEKLRDVSPADPCPCGSGFTFEECHIGALTGERTS